MVRAGVIARMGKRGGRVVEGCVLLQDCAPALLFLSHWFSTLGRLASLFANLAHDRVVGLFDIDAGLGRGLDKAHSQTTGESLSFRLSGR